MSSDSGVTDRAGARGRIDLELTRLSGAALTVVGGPAAGLFAWLALGMGPIEIAGVVFLISAWIGPRLMGAGSR